MVPRLSTSSAIDSLIPAVAPGSKLLRDLMRLREHFGDTPIDKIGQLEIDMASIAIFPCHSASTRGTHVHVPMRKVLHHAGCHVLIRGPKRPKPNVAVLSQQTADFLIECADDPEFRVLLVFQFYTGVRISETMKLTFDRIDFENERVLIRLARRHIDQWRPLHPRVVEALKTLPRQEGRVFRWMRDTMGPDKPLKRLRARSGIHVTYKSMRYSFAYWLRGNETNLRDIMDACGWGAPHSALRILGDDGKLAGDAIRRL